LGQSDIEVFSKKPGSVVPSIEGFRDTCYPTNVPNHRFAIAVANYEMLSFDSSEKVQCHGSSHYTDWLRRVDLVYFVSVISSPNSAVAGDMTYHSGWRPSIATSWQLLLLAVPTCCDLKSTFTWI
jgi:hypothetical protein